MVQKDKPQLHFGFPSVLLGALSLLTAFVPFTSLYVSLVFSSAGITFGLIARGKKEEIGTFGIILSFLGILAAMFYGSALRQLEL